MGNSTKKKSPWGMIIGTFIFFGFVYFIFVDDGNPPSGGDSSYVLPLGDDFNTALASRDDLGISVVIAVDVSGSMSGSPTAGGEAKYIQATKALEEVFSVLNRLTKDSPKEQIIKVGMLKFSSEVEIVLPMTIVSQKALGKIKALAANPRTWTPDGATAIGSALEEGVKMLSQSGTILRSLIIVTDGENTEGVEPPQVLSAIYGNKNDKSTPDFPVSTNSTLISFIGFDVDSGYFDSFKTYGARVTSASNQAQLATSLSSLLEADITKLEAPELGGER